MRKILQKLMLAALIMLPLASNAQNPMTVLIGDSTSTSQTYYMPVNNYYNYSLVRMIVDADEIGDAMSIESISFYYATSNTMEDATDVRIYLQHTDRASFATSTDFEPMASNAVQVYSGNLNCTTGWNTFTFTTPFIYDGESNLMIIVHDNATGYDGTSYKFAYTSTTGTNTSHALYSDSYNPDPTTTTYSGSKAVYAYRPVMSLNGTQMAMSGCRKVKNLTATNVTAEGLTLTWVDTLNSGATYTVYDMSDSSILATGLTATTYNVTNLEGNTEYTFGVEANCSATDNATIATVSLRTACAAMDLPWTCSFEAEEIMGTANADALPWCSYRYQSAHTSTTPYPYSYSSTTYSHTGSRSLYFYGTTGTTYPDTMTFTLPAVDVTTYPMNGNRITFWARSSSATYDKTVYVGTLTDPTDPSTYAYVGSVTVSGTTHTKYSVPLTTAAATAPYVCITVMRGSGNLYIDDMTLEEMPACLEVVSAAVAGTTANTMTLNWVANSENATATYSVYNMADTSLVMSGITDTFYTVTGLNPATLYTFGVQANCPAGDAAMMTASAYTGCAPMNLPFVETFDATLASHPCWRGATGTTAAEVFAGASLTLSTISAGYWNYSTSQNGFTDGHYYNNIYGTSRKAWMITPEIDLSSATTAQLSFDLALTAYSGTMAAPATYTGGQKFMVIVSTDGGNTWLQNNATVWMHADSNADYSFQDIPYDHYANYIINLTQYVGDTIKIAFYGESTVSGGDNDFHVDNIVVEEMPSCFIVTDLAVDSVTGTSVSLSWNDTINTGATYTVYNMADTSVVATNVATTSCEITGLTASTGYTFGVVANCSATDNSNIVTISAVTGCAGNSCAVTVYAQDEYGDGWNGAILTIAQNGATVATYTMADQGLDDTPIYDTFQVSVCSGTPVTFNWTAGNYDEEISFSIADGSNTVAYTVADASDLTSGLVYTMAEACAAPTYTVTLTADSTMGTVTGAGTYDEGDTVTVTATALAGYHFVNWTDGTTAVSTDNPYSFVIAADVALTAVFEANPPMEYTVTLTADATMGTVTGAGTYTEGDTVTVTATALDGYHFVNWTDGTNAVSSDNPYSFVITADVNLTAVFEANAPQPPAQYTVTVTVNNTTMGTVTGGGQYEEGTTVTLTATANDGFTFVGWVIGNDTISDNPYTFTITGNVNAMALFTTANGIEDADMANVTIYSVDSRIVVSGAEGRDINVYDLTGRTVSTVRNAAGRAEMRMPNTGVYLVKVGTAAAKRVIVVR